MWSATNLKQNTTDVRPGGGACADLDCAHVRQVAPRVVRPLLGAVQVRLAAAAARRQPLDLLPGRLLSRLVVLGLQG